MATITPGLEAHVFNLLLLLNQTEQINQTQEGNISDLILFLDQTEPINQPYDPITTWISISFSVVTIFLNSWAVIVMLKKETSGINNLVIVDYSEYTVC